MIYSLRHTYATFRLQEGIHQYILARSMGMSSAKLETHYWPTSNVVDPAELRVTGREQDPEDQGDGFDNGMISMALD